MSEREARVAKAVFGNRGREWSIMERLTAESQAKRALTAADTPILELIEEAENRRGSSMYCKVTTHELRKALGLKGAGDE